MPAHLRRKTLAAVSKESEETVPVVADSKKEVAPKEVKKTPKEKEPVPLNKKAQKKKTV